MLKQILITLIALITFTNQVFAEGFDSDKLFKTFRFALFVGPTYNKMKPTAASSEDYFISKGKANLGFNFGIQAEYNMNERYSIYTGCGLDWRGGEIKAVHDVSKPLANGYLKDADVKYKKMQYLTIPLGMKMKAFDVKDIKVYAQTGLDLGILLSQKGDYSLRLANDSMIVKTQEKLGGTATVVPINMGWCIGAGAEYSLNDKNSVFASILYRNGFIDATTPKTNDQSLKFSDGNIRSNSILIRIGYFF